MTGAEFQELRQSLGLNRSQMAGKLGLSRNQPKKYEDGTIPIPHYIALACAAVAFNLPPYGS